MRRYTSGAYFIVSAAGILVSALFIVLMVRSTDTGHGAAPSPFLWLWIFLAVFFLFLNTGPSNTILANVTHPSVRANAFALNILIIHALGDAISPPLIGVIADKFNDAGRPAHGLEVGFVFTTILMVVGSVLWLFGMRFLAR